MLEYQHVPIKFKGIDQKTDDKNVTEGDFLSLQNVEMQKTFQLRNRRGFIKKVAAQQTGVIGAARVGNSYGLVNTSGAVYSPDSVASIDSRGYCYEFDNPIELTTSENNQGYSISAGVNNVGVVLTTSMRDGTYVDYNVSTFNVLTGARIYAVTEKISLALSAFIGHIATSQASSGYTASINPIDGNFSRIYIFDATGALAKSISLNGVGITNVTDIILQYTGTDHLLTIAYKAPAAGVISLRTYTLSTDTWTAITTTATNVTTKFALNKGSTSSRFALCWYDTTGFIINVAILNTLTFALIDSITQANAFTTAVPLVMACVDRGVGVSPGVIFTAYVARAGAGEAAINTYLNNITSPSSLNISRSYYPSARPIMIGTDCYVQWVTVPLTVNSAGTVKNLDEYSTGVITKNNTIISTFASGKYILSQGSYGLAYTQSYPCEFVIDSAKIFIPAAFRKKYAFGFGEIESEMRLLKGVATLSPATSSLGGESLFNINGAVIPFTLGGITCANYGPIGVTNLTVKTSAAGGLITAGTYQYIGVKVLSNGSKYLRGTPTAPVSAVTTGATSSNTLRITSFGSRYTFVESATGAESDNVFIEIYRTLAGGSVYYLAGTVGTIGTDFVDTLSDTTLAGRPILLSPSGILDASLPPLCRGATVVKNRIFAASAEERGTAVFTTVGTSDEEPRFNEALKLTIRAPFSKIIGFAELDDKIIIFCDDSIYATFGDGPDEMGLNGYPEPQLISSGIGCRSQRSIVQTPDGTMFQSNDGIKLLGRGLDVQDVGSMIEDFNDYTISSALNFTDRDQVWFFTVEGTTFVWDRYHKIWYTFTGMPSYAAFIDSNNVPVFCKSSTNYLLKESESAFNDDSATFNCVLESGNVTLSGIQGFQRMRRLSWISSLVDNATVELWSNFNAASDETITINASTVGTPHQFEVKPKVQKVEAKRWKITVPAITGICTFSGFSVEAGLKKGSYRKSTSKRVGG